MSETKADQALPLPSRARGHAAAGIVLAIAASVGFWPLTLHPTDLVVGPQGDGLNDLTRYFLPAREQQGEALARLDGATCWNPLILAGMPRFGNPQSGLLYPPNWLYALVPARLLISWMIVAHHAWAGWGTYLLCRRYGFCWFASVLAGLSFLSAPYLLAQTAEGHYAQICLVAWTPFAFLGIERLRRQDRGGTALMAAVLALCFFCGHVQELFYLVLLLTAYLTPDIAGCLRRSRDDPQSPGFGRRDAARLAGRWLLVGAAVAGLTAIELLPMWAYSRQSVRYVGVGVEQLRQGSLEWANLLQVLDPFVLGTATNCAGVGRYCETLCCFGLPTLVLAVAGVAGAYRRYPVCRLAILFFASLLFAFGTQTPVFPLLERLLPGVSLFRSPSRALFFCSFFAAILAGAGCNALLSLSADARRRCRRVLLVVSALTLCLAGVGLSWRWGAPASLETQATTAALSRWTVIANNVDWRLPLGMLAGVLSAAWLLASAERYSSWAMMLVLSLVGLEFACHAGRMLRTIPPEAMGRANPVAKFLTSRVGTGRVLAGQDLLSDREAWRYGIQKVQGYDPVPSARLALYGAALTGTEDSDRYLLGFESPRLSSLRKPLADALGVRYAIVPGKNPPEVAGWRRVTRGSLMQEFTLRNARPAAQHCAIYENASPLPRAFVVGQVRLRLPTGDVLQQLADLAPRREVFLDRDLLPPGARQAFSAAEIVEYRPERVRVQATLTAPGYLVLSDAYYPGWSAWVDGRPVPLVPANLAFRAVPLDPGRHGVEFRYEPPGWKAGAFITALSLVALLASLHPRRWGHSTRRSA